MQLSKRSGIHSASLLAAIPLAGCARAPTFNILGSYFPAWLLCVIAGVAGASAVSGLLGRFWRQHLLRWTIVVYPCLAASIAFTLWLVLFS
jgi:Mn2+/Fe2+ NRAMP family transporter